MPADPRDPASHRAGLCASCRFVEMVTTSRDSTFYRCRLAETDATFRRYPVLPVLSCRGYQPEKNDARSAS